ncbi:hypothetical protein BLD25_01940 [Candidatus Gracilibacteria bacterium GN02-872]|nr:hypothetical protein BLD25_01940 [Candidatus Gracilibacteria bacterium GN02-872]RKW20650.1 MAG: hypothetical protein D8B46_09190 [Candidatus Gracilibacteria bacterium]
MLIFRNLLKVLKSPTGLFGTVIGVLIIAIPSYLFTDKQTIVFNMGIGIYTFEIVLSFLIAILFGIFLGATIYKIKYFSVKKTGVGVFAGFIGVLVSGCPACSLSLASFFGLAGFLQFFPYGGIELKAISVLLLLFACYNALKNLETCNLKLKRI